MIIMLVLSVGEKEVYLNWEKQHYIYQNVFIYLSGTAIGIKIATLWLQ